MNALRRICTLALLTVALSACGGVFTPATPTPVPPTSTAASLPPTADPTAASTEMPSPSAFEGKTYEDAEAGFAFEYPQEWAVDGPQGGGDRGYYIQITSFAHPPGQIPDETPPGGSRMDVSVLLWEPVNDLDAYVEVRKVAWESSGFGILEENRITLDGGLPAAEFILQVPGDEAYYLLAPVGDRYVVFSGVGDLELLGAISRTLRTLTPSY